ncbi:hypothetical protein FisN_15Lh026 [Fistulifera solaris]|uniref:BTB domain-containing protein n=1 Tax=Fistulifera solaris TaxID=1519565 RepID=A0A1Z5KI82_FISSO|nr:hypothetical protein FisN_15Lh026 [Fistulifera solaris]|eukprot:GAX25658.1 hypothetical protein FisN_15Lh026 [Fistulifera solaris]
MTSTNVVSFDSWDYDSTRNDHTEPQTHNQSLSPELIPVTVSGQLYSLEPHLFDKLRRLPWTIPSPTTSFFSRLPRNAAPIQYSLRTAPYLFDILVSYVQSGSLPDLTTLRTADLEELEPLVMLLKLPVLQKHLQLQQWGMRMSSSAPPLTNAWWNESSSSSSSSSSNGDPEKHCSNENLEFFVIQSGEHSLDTSVAPRHKHAFLQKIRRTSNRPKKDAMTSDDVVTSHLQEIEENSIGIDSILPDRLKCGDQRKSQGERSLQRKQNKEPSRPIFLRKLRAQCERRMSHAEVCASSDLIN